jgi:hypothetical protein
VVTTERPLPPSRRRSSNGLCASRREASMRGLPTSAVYGITAEPAPRTTLSRSNSFAWLLISTRASPAVIGARLGSDPRCRRISDALPGGSRELGRGIGAAGGCTRRLRCGGALMPQQRAASPRRLRRRSR